MECREAIEKRRSIRTFKKDDIEDEIIEDILNCGRLAPSAKNRQPWYFVVVRNPEKEEIVRIMEEWKETADIKEYEAHLGYKSSVPGSSRIIREAPVIILVFYKKENGWIEGDNLSIGAAIENMILRATSLGIGSLWIRDTNSVKEKIAKLVGLENLELNSTIALGYTAENPKPRPRKDLKDIMIYYKKGK